MLIVKMYATLLGPIIAGIINSIFCSLKVCNKLKVPMDFNKKFIDGKRIFGDNKTWKGFFGYIVFNIIIAVILGMIFNLLHANQNNFFYVYHSNTIKYNISNNNTIICIIRIPHTTKLFQILCRGNHIIAIVFRG